MGSAGPMKKSWVKKPNMAIFIESEYQPFLISAANACDFSDTGHPQLTKSK